MNIEQLLRSSLNLPDGFNGDRTPADHVSRQAWQEAVEHFMTRIRTEFARPAFGLTEAEISIHYHRSLSDFVQLIAKKLGYNV